MALTWTKVAVLFTIVTTLAGCSDESSDKPCSDKGEDFFRQSINDYFKNHPPANTADKIEVLKGAVYDDHTNWWIVPVDVGAEKWNALLSCDGHLELSGRPGQ